MLAQLVVSSEIQTLADGIAGVQEGYRLPSLIETFNERLVYDVIVDLFHHSRLD